MNEAARAGLEAGFTFFLFAAGVLIAYLSWGYGFGSLARPGPGLYPFFVGSAIALFAAILLGQAGLATLGLTGAALALTPLPALLARRRVGSAPARA